MKEGLTASAVTYFIQTATNFKSNIRISYHGKSANAKSLLGVIVLDIGAQTTVELTADGADEADAIKALSEFLEVDISAAP